MQITGLGNVNQANSAKKKAKTTGGGFAAHLTEAGEAESANAPSGVFAPNSLFMLQEVSDEEYPRQKAIQEGHDALDYLDKIRVGLLTGSISGETLKNLDGLINQWRSRFTDPKLQSIIEEIEVRAAVELAKLEVMG